MTTTVDRTLVRSSRSALFGRRSTTRSGAVVLWRANVRSHALANFYRMRRPLAC
ncbi:MAG: hypothetical protein ACYC1I_05650 [Acidimicrobiales bacterium]